MIKRVEFKAPQLIPEDVIRGFAIEWAEFRLGGVPDGFYGTYRKRVGKAAKKYGRSFSEIWAPIHKRAYQIIDADPRSRLSTAEE